MGHYWDGERWGHHTGHPFACPSISRTASWVGHKQVQGPRGPSWSGSAAVLGSEHPLCTPSCFSHGAHSPGSGMDLTLGVIPCSSRADPRPQNPLLTTPFAPRPPAAGEKAARGRTPRCPPSTLPRSPRDQSREPRHVRGRCPSPRQATINHTLCPTRRSNRASRRLSVEARLQVTLIKVFSSPPLLVLPADCRPVTASFTP